MANKYKFGRDFLTVNGRTFPARYEVLEHDEARGSFYTVVIIATVDGGKAARIEVPATDKQHGAALAAAQMAALVDLATATEEQQPAPTEAAENTQTAPEAAQNEKEAQTMKRQTVKKYNVYFTDHPAEAATVEAVNKREAEKLGRQYIREWGLDAKIDRVERVTDPAPDLGPSAAVVEAGEVQQEPTTAADHSTEKPATAADHFTEEQPAAQDAPTAPEEAPEEPAPDVLEEIGGRTMQPAQGGAEAVTEADPAPDPKATRGPVPEKTFKNETISGNGWSIVFDGGCNRTRVIISDPIKAAARPIVEAAGFYYSKALDSWNKKLTFRAYRAANNLAAQLRRALA